MRTMSSSSNTPSTPEPRRSRSPTAPSQIEPIRRPYRKRSYASSACQMCKKKHHKCSGGPPPCTGCITSNSECVFEWDQDRRRITAVKRKRDDADHSRDLLIKLFSSIRWSDEAQAQQILRLIRSDAPLEQISVSIDEATTSLREGTPQTNDTISDLLRLRAGAESLKEQSRSSRMKRKTMSIEHITDQPPISVPAQPWTRVTEDNFVASHLVSIFFTWWNPLLRPVNEAAFVEAMQSRDLNSPLCSPLLVNGILALACCYSDLPQALGASGHFYSRGEHFFQEAQRLWEEEAGRGSLINVQALFTLCLYCNVQGKDKVGWSILFQMVAMYKDLGLARAVKYPRLCPPELRHRWERSWVTTAWGVFNLTSMLAMFLYKTPAMPPPEVGRPATSEDEMQHTVEWSPYPRTFNSGRLHLNVAFNASCDFSVFAYKAAVLLAAENGKFITQPDIEQLMSQLQEWHDTLPAAIRLYPAAPGPLVALHSMYYWCALTLNDFSEGISSSPATATPSSDNSESTSQSSTLSIPRKRSLALIRDMMPMYRNFRSSYGILRTHASINQAAVTAMFILLKSLPGIGDDTEPLTTDAAEAAMVDLAAVLMACARRWLTYAGVVRMLRPTAHQLNVQIPASLREMLDEFDRTSWEIGTHKKISSSYPNLSLYRNGIESRYEAREEMTMGELLDRWEALSLAPTDLSQPNPL